MSTEIWPDLLAADGNTQPFPPVSLLILMAGKWFDWWGGLTRGYRPIVDAAPFLALLMIPIVERIVASPPPTGADGTC